MKPVLISLSLLLSASLAQAQLTLPPQPTIRLYEAGLASGIVIQPGQSRCLVMHSFEALPDKQGAAKTKDSLRAESFVGKASGQAHTTDSFCFDAFQRLVHFYSVMRSEKGLRPSGNYDAKFENTDTGLVQTITFADLPGTTVTTLFRNDLPVWSQTYGRGMLAVQEQYQRNGARTEVLGKSFVMPGWHLKKVEERQPDGELWVQQYVPQGPDTNGSNIEFARYNPGHQVLQSFTLKARRRTSEAEARSYDTVQHFEYHYDKEGRLTAAGSVLRLKYKGHEAWPDEIWDSTRNHAGEPKVWKIRYQQSKGRLLEVLVYERMKLPRPTKKGAYYFELRTKYELSYPQE